MLGKNNLSERDISRQLAHLKDMAQGKNHPYKYGDFTLSEIYDHEQQLIHGDGFGHYLHGNNDFSATHNRAVFSVNDSLILDNTPHNTKISMMHARLVTKGSKEDHNIQPFDLEHIVGMHNGTVSGLESGTYSDSRGIMDILDNHYSNHSADDIEALEQTILEIYEQSDHYSGMNVICYLKDEGKVVVISSYNQSEAMTKTAEEYYTLHIDSDGETIYISSEAVSGQGNTENHTVYVIDEETGEVTEHKLENLEEAVEEGREELAEAA